MTKLADMFTQARRSQGGSGIGFLGKSKPTVKPRAAALVVEFADIDAGDAESAVKAGADGLLFTWDGKDTAQRDALKATIEAAKTANENTVFGLHITGGWKTLERELLEQLKEQGVNYIVLPLTAPARLLGMRVKDLDMAVTVPMREGEMYPIFIRNLSAFDAVAAIHLDFGLAGEVGAMSIEDIMHYRAVREAVRFPALLNVRGNVTEADAYTLLTLGPQAIILTASDTAATTGKQIHSLRELLEQIYHEEKENEPSPTLPGSKRSE